MKFEEWFNEIEVFSLRGERFYDELEHYKDGAFPADNIVKWLRAAYDVGYEHAISKLVDDGK